MRRFGYLDRYPVSNEFKKAVLGYLELNKMTQTKLAADTNVSFQRLNKILRGVENVTKEDSLIPTIGNYIGYTGPLFEKRQPVG